MVYCAAWTKREMIGHRWAVWLHGPVWWLRARWQRRLHAPCPQSASSRRRRGRWPSGRRPTCGRSETARGPSARRPPPCAFRPINRFFYITNDAKLDRVPEIAEEIKTIAAENGTELIDLYALTQGRRELFGPDGLHPNTAGARLIAEAVFRTLCDRSGQGSDTRSKFSSPAALVHRL